MAELVRLQTGSGQEQRCRHGGGDSFGQANSPKPETAKLPDAVAREFLIEGVCQFASHVGRHSRGANPLDAALATTLGANPAFHQLDMASDFEQQGLSFPLSPFMARSDATPVAYDDARLASLCHFGPQLSGPRQVLLYHSCGKQGSVKGLRRACVQGRIELWTAGNGQR